MGRVFRSVLQLVAGGGLTALILQVAKDVPESYAPYLVLVSTGLVAIAQIGVEELSGTGLLRGEAGRIDRLRSPLKSRV